MKKIFAPALLAAIFGNEPVLSLQAQIEAACIDGKGFTVMILLPARVFPPVKDAPTPLLPPYPSCVSFPMPAVVAMGDVGIATSVDPNGMHYNPSKLAFADKKCGYFGYLYALDA